MQEENKYDIESSAYSCHPNQEAKDKAQIAVRKLLQAGADYNLIALLASEHGIDYRSIATELVNKDEIEDEEGVDTIMKLQEGLLRRSNSILQDDQFFEKMM